jgi:hypothetical protein
VTIIRTSPIPVGRYWVDLIGDAAQQTWADSVRVWNAPTARVHVETTEYVPATGSDSSRAWVLFRVLEPIDWEFASLPGPTVAGDEISSSADTASKPDLPKDPSDQISDAISGVGMTTGVKVGLGLAAGGLVMLGLGMLLGGRRR